LERKWERWLNRYRRPQRFFYAISVFEWAESHGGIIPRFKIGEKLDSLKPELQARKAAQILRARMNALLTQLHSFLPVSGDFSANNFRKGALLGSQRRPCLILCGLSLRLVVEVSDFSHSMFLWGGSN